MTLNFQVSFNGTDWVQAYGQSASVPYGILTAAAASAPDPVGEENAYFVMTPRYIRLRGQIEDPNTGLPYDGADDPTFTFTLTYTAG